MCTQTRGNAVALRCAEIASSKSFAVSGSIVNVSRSLESLRPSSDGSGRVEGLELAAHPLVLEQGLQHRLDPVSGAERPLEARGRGRDHDRELPLADVGGPFLSRERDARREVRLAYQPPAAGDPRPRPGHSSPESSQARSFQTTCSCSCSPVGRRGLRVPRRPGVRAVGVLAARARGLGAFIVMTYHAASPDELRHATAGREPPGLALGVARGAGAARMAGLERAGSGVASVLDPAAPSARPSTKTESAPSTRRPAPRHPSPHRRVEDRRQRDLLAQRQQHDREQGAGSAAEQPLEHERPAHEPV